MPITSTQIQTFKTSAVVETTQPLFTTDDGTAQVSDTITEIITTAETVTTAPLLITTAGISHSTILDDQITGGSTAQATTPIQNNDETTSQPSTAAAEGTTPSVTAEGTAAPTTSPIITTSSGTGVADELTTSGLPDAVITTDGGKITSGVPAISSECPATGSETDSPEAGTRPLTSPPGSTVTEQDEVTGTTTQGHVVPPPNNENSK